MSRRRADDIGGKTRAEIGGDQQLLELVQRRLVELALGDDSGDALGQIAARSARGLASAARKTRPRS
jgi:hypothetical protein